MSSDFDSFQRCNCDACYAFKLHLSKRARQKRAEIFMTEEEEEELDYEDTLEPDSDYDAEEENPQAS